jgi:hypothetical protein
MTREGLLSLLILMPMYAIHPPASASHSISHLTQKTDKEHSPSTSTSIDLNYAAQQFIAAIKGGKPLDLLPFWSDAGVTFGIDGDPVSGAQFKKDVEHKGDLYCFFFDTDCLRKRDDEMRRKAKAPARKNTLYSYQELLIKSKTTVVKVSQHRDAGTLVGNVRVPLENGEALKGNTQTELRFVFTPDHDSWKLTSVQYD